MPSRRPRRACADRHSLDRARTPAKARADAGAYRCVVRAGFVMVLRYQSSCSAADGDNPEHQLRRKWCRRYDTQPAKSDQREMPVSGSAQQGSTARDRNRCDGVARGKQNSPIKSTLSTNYSVGQSLLPLHCHSALHPISQEPGASRRGNARSGLVGWDAHAPATQWARS